MTNHEIMIDRGETQSKPVNFINRKIAALTVAGSMLLDGAGCAEARTVDTSNNIPTSVEDTVGTSATTKLVTPEITVTPTPTPTEAPTPTPEIVKDPKIAGTKVVENEEGTFLVAVNENGEIKEGEYIGEYRDNVFVDGEKVEAWALTPSEAEKLLNDELAKIPADKLKIKVILPIDALQTKGDINISNKNDILGNSMLSIKTSEAVDVLNVIPNYDDLYIYWFPYEGKTLGCPMYIGQDLGDNLNTMTNENAMYFLQTIYPSSETMNEKTTNLKSYFGGVIGNSDGGEVTIGCGDESGTYSITKDSILKTADGSYVFMTSKIGK